MTQRTGRIDYARLHSDGVIIPKESVTPVQQSTGNSLSGPEDSTSSLSSSCTPIVSPETESLKSYSELPFCVVDGHSSSSESSTESTLTPASSGTESLDPLDCTLTTELLVSPSWNSTSDAKLGLAEVIGEMDSTIKMSQETTKIKELEGKVNVMIDDLNDFMDENPMIDAHVDDIDEYIRRVEDTRTMYRDVHRHLLDEIGETEYTPKHKSTYDMNLLSMKNYIKLGKQRKSDVRKMQAAVEERRSQVQAGKQDETERQRTITTQFLHTEINRMITQLDAIFATNLTDFTDDDIRMREELLPDNLQEVDRLSDKVQKLMEIIPDSYPKRTLVISELKNSYGVVMKNKDVYRNSLFNQGKTRELDK